MSNTFNYVDWLTMEGLAILKNKLEVSRYFNKTYSKQYEKDFAVGGTIRVPLPQRYSIRNGLTYSAQALDRPTTTITMQSPFGVDFEWDSAEKALYMERGQDKIRKDYLEPAMVKLAQEIDSRCAQYAYLNTNNIVGVLGTDPTTLTPSAQARQRMYELAGIGSEMGLIIPPQVNTSLVPAFSTLFNPADAIAKQYRKGTIGTAQGFIWHESMSLYDHTAGTWAGAVTVASAPTEGSNSLSLTCTTGDTFKAGDVIAIANVYAVNPETGRITTRGTTKQFVILADVTGAASAATVTVSPAFISTGHYQNIDSLPAVSAALTLFPGTSSPSGKSGKQGLALSLGDSAGAFALVGCKLELPTAVEMKSQTQDPESGISVRFVRQWDNINSRMTNRFDVMIGFGNLYPDNCSVRYLSA